MNRKLFSQLFTNFGFVLFLMVGCSQATPAPTIVSSAPAPIQSTALPVPPTAPTLVITNEVKCWTVATVVEPGSPPKLGGTSIKVQFEGYSYRGVVGGGGFVVPTGGSIDKVNIGGKEVELKTHDFGKGSIDTKEYGTMEVLFRANINSDCGILIATPAQLSKLAAEDQ